MMPSAASAPCSFAQAFAGGSRPSALKASSKPAAASANSDGQRHHAARSRKRRFQRHHHQPDRGERADAAGAPGHRRHQAGERQRGEHVRALVTAGAREEIGDQDRRHQPGEHADFERARHAAKGDIDRKARERGKAADQARRNEGAVARRRQRILLRRRVHQRIDIVPHRREETHGPCRTSLTTDAPLFRDGKSSQTRLSER